MGAGKKRSMAEAGSENPERSSTGALPEIADCAAERKRRSDAAAVVNLGLAANAVLAISKLAAGIIGHSQALLADGVNSISDVVYFIVVRIFTSLSAKPADPEHPYGHHQFESISAVVVGAFVITTGMAIFWDSVNAAFDMWTGNASEEPIRRFTLWVAFFTIALKIFLLLQASKVSRRTGNITISALARDHRNDIFASAGVAAGIGFGLLGVEWMDPVAGAVVAVLVTKTGIDILRESADELMDSVPSREIDATIRNKLSGFRSIRRIESIHAHRFGPYFVVNITVAIDGRLSVFEGDRIADEIEAHLVSEIHMLRKVYVHYHPLRRSEKQRDPK
ncbi:cation transporter [bacterium]|nr:cation transporter [bacterium]